MFVPQDFNYQYKAVLTNKSSHAKNVTAYHEGRGSQEGLFAELKSQGAFGVMHGNTNDFHSQKTVQYRYNRELNTAANNIGAATEDTVEVVALREEVAELKHQLAWFKKQLFGSKSEKRPEEHQDQLRLFGNKQSPVPEDQPKQKITYERGKFKKQRGDDGASEEGLRFDPSVPVKTIVLPVPGAQGLSEEGVNCRQALVTRSLCCNMDAGVALRAGVNT